MENKNDSSLIMIMDRLFADLKCKICLQVFINATLTNCNHIFCEFCLKKWLQFFHTCPTCMKPVSIVNCTCMQNVDNQVDNIIKNCPLSLRQDRQVVAEKRRLMEQEDCQSRLIIDGSNLLEKLRVPTTKISLTREEENWLEQLCQHLDVGKKENCQLKLPRLVPLNSNNQIPCPNLSFEETEATDKNVENVKLPAIKLTGQRQSRGITTSTLTQNTQDAFPRGMEGDLLDADENIRELEQRNQYLEQELFGAYDRLIDSISDPPDTINSTNANANKNGQNSNLLASDKSPTSTGLNTDDTGSANGLNDLLAETEDLIEIENFLKQFPFSRMRDDDELVGYNSDDFDNFNLDLLDENHIKDISTHEIQLKSSKKKLTKDQEAIENFYKKLQNKRLHGMMGPAKIKFGEKLSTKKLVSIQSTPGQSKRSSQSPAAAAVNKNSKRLNSKVTTNVNVNCQKLPPKIETGLNHPPSQKLKNKPKTLVTDTVENSDGLESALGLSYDFLKLKVDFLDGNGDWKLFKQNSDILSQDNLNRLEKIGLKSNEEDMKIKNMERLFKENKNSQNSTI